MQENSSSDNTSYYKEFGVNTKADIDEIRKAYKKKMKTMHPDKGGDPEKFKRMQEIYEVLSDPKKKQIYDQYGEEGLKEGGGMGFDPFSDFFGGGMGGFGGGMGGGRQVKRKCKSKLIEHTITLSEAFTGAKKTAEFQRRILCKSCNGTGSDNPAAVRSCEGCKGVGVRLVVQRMGGMLFQTQQTCPECKGQGKINTCLCETCNGEKVAFEKKILNLDIEKGTYEGYRFNFIGEGDEYPEIETGDVVVEILIDPCKEFLRKGADLTYKKTITLYEALTGVSFVLNHLDGRKILIKSNPGEIITPGVLKTVKDQGMPFYNQTFKNGNLYIDFIIDFPSALDVENSNEILEKVLDGYRLNKEVISEKDEVERYKMFDFNIEDENTHHAGGKKENRRDNDDENDDEYGGRRQNVQCAQQ